MSGIMKKIYVAVMTVMWGILIIGSSASMIDSERANARHYGGGVSKLGGRVSKLGVSTQSSLLSLPSLPLSLPSLPLSLPSLPPLSLPSLPLSLPSLPLDIQLSFRSQYIRVKENAGQVVIPIARSGSLIPITIQVKTEDGSAIGGMDYRRTSGAIVFEDGVSEAKIEIIVINDQLVEDDETFSVLLLNPPIGVGLGVKLVTVTIEDDDRGVIERRVGGSASAVVTSRPQSFPNPAPESYGSGLLTRCPQNLILRTCANTCPRTCSSVYGEAPCSYNGGCIRGCFGPDGLVKESESSNRCIRPSECSRGRY